MSSTTEDTMDRLHYLADDPNARRVLQGRDLSEMLESDGVDPRNDERLAEAYEAAGEMLEEYPGYLDAQGVDAPSRLTVRTGTLDVVVDPSEGHEADDPALMIGGWSHSRKSDGDPSWFGDQRTYQREGFEDTGCKIGLNVVLGADGEPKFIDEITRHELSHCGLDQFFSTAERRALYGHIAEQVPFDTIRSDWFGATGLTGSSDDRFARYMTRLGLNESVGEWTHMHDGVRYVNAAALDDPRFAGPLGTLMEEAAMFRGTAPDPLAWDRDGRIGHPPEGAHATGHYVHGMMSDVLAVYRNERSREDLKERYDGTLGKEGFKLPKWLRKVLGREGKGEGPAGEPSRGREHGHEHARGEEAATRQTGQEGDTAGGEAARKRRAIERALAETRQQAKETRAALKRGEEERAPTGRSGSRQARGSGAAALGRSFQPTPAKTPDAERGPERGAQRGAGMELGM